MGWTQGPFDEQAVLWLGLKVFAWRRIVSAIQIFCGASVLAGLLTEQHKLRIHALLDESASAAKAVTVPPLIKLGSILKWHALASVTLGVLLASVVRVPLTTGATLPFGWAAVFLTLMVALFAIPLAQLVLLGSATYTAFKAGQRYVPPALAWLFHHKRFDRSLTLITFALFVASSCVGLYLS